MDSSAQLGLALRQIEGVGRVTTRKMIHSFDSYESLIECPFEQLLHRLKGASNRNAIAKKMRSKAVMEPLLEQAENQLTELRQKGVHVLTARHKFWPEGIRELPKNHQPDLLFAYGPLQSLNTKRVALFGAESLDAEPFEAAQSLIRPLSEQDILPVAGCHDGFDVVMHKRASAFRGRGSLMVAHAGLSRIQKPFRPVASGSVRSGGMMISSFPMNHGPFDHDDVERAYLQAALADICLFFNASPGSPEQRALSWVSRTAKPVYRWPGIQSANLDDIHLLNPEHILTEVMHHLGK